MTTTLATTDAEAFAERLIADTTTFAEYLSMSLGLDLGLYAALSDRGPARPGELAARAGIAPRYAREWLEQQAAAGYVICSDPAADPEERQFELPVALAAVLLTPDSGVYVGPLVSMVRGVIDVHAELREAYRSGGGVSYAAYGEGIRHGLAELNGATYDSALGDWIAALPDVHDRLVHGEAPRILDLGCGEGRSSLALARRFPRATVRGIDLDPASVEAARTAAASAGLAHRVTFSCEDAARIEGDQRYDLAVMLEALHDMGDPVGVLRSARALLADGGVLYLADERVADQFTPAADLVERMQYAFSVLHCLPATLAEDPVVAHGTVLRAPTVRAWADAAGFHEVLDLEVEDPFWRHYRLDA